MYEKEYYTDEEMLELLREFERVNNRRPKMVDFKGKKPSDSVIAKRFGNWLNALKLAGITFDKLKENDYTTEYLRNTLLEYYNKYNKVPTVRELKSKGYPTIHAYINHFGSFKNALDDVGLLILREDKHQFCDTYTDKELLDKLRNYMKDKDRIPVGNELRELKELSFSTYDRRFGSIFKAFKLIGYDIEQQRESDLIKLKEDMLDKYKEIQQLLGRTPHSRDIEDFSRNKEGYYSMSSYEFHFGSVIQLQKLCGFDLVIVGLHKTREELIKDLQEFAKELGRTPLREEIKNNHLMAGDGKYSSVFGSWNNAILEAGLEINNKTYLSRNGDKCFSVYELSFNDMLINNKLEYQKEIYYRSVISDFDKAYRFDFSVNYNDKVYFIEIFGINNNKDYDIKTAEKIQLCKENNIPLLEFYPKNFYTTIHGDLYTQLMNKIKEYDTQLQPVNV